MVIKKKLKTGKISQHHFSSHHLIPSACSKEKVILIFSSFQWLVSNAVHYHENRKYSSIFRFINHQALNSKGLRKIFAANISCLSLHSVDKIYDFQMQILSYLWCELKKDHKNRILKVCKLKFGEEFNWLKQRCEWSMEEFNFFGNTILSSF